MFYTSTIRKRHQSNTVVTVKHCLRTVTVISYGFLSLAASDMNLHNKITHSFIIDCFSNIYLKRNLVLKLADRVIEIVTLWIVTSIVCFYSILYLIYIFGQRPWARILELILWNVFFTLSSKFQMCLVFLAITTSWIALYDLIICTSNTFVECNTFFFSGNHSITRFQTDIDKIPVSLFRSQWQ